MATRAGLAGGEIAIIGMPGEMDAVKTAGNDSCAPIIITYNSTVLTPQDHGPDEKKLVFVSGTYAGQIAIIAGKNATFQPQ